MISLLGPPEQVLQPLRLAHFDTVMGSLTQFSMRMFCLDLERLRWQVAGCKTQKELDALVGAEEEEEEEDEEREPVSNQLMADITEIEINEVQQKGSEEAIIRLGQRPNFQKRQFEILFDLLAKKTWLDVSQFAVRIGVVVGTAGSKQKQFLEVMKQKWSNGINDTNGKADGHFAYAVGAAIIYAHDMTQRKNIVRKQKVSTRPFVDMVAEMVKNLLPKDSKFVGMIVSLWAGAAPEDRKKHDIIGVSSFLKEADPANWDQLSTRVEDFVEKQETRAIKDSYIKWIRQSSTNVDRRRKKIRDGEMDKYLNPPVQPS